MDDSDSDNDNAPSPYMASLFKKNVPQARRAVTINTDNPLNQATAYPSMHVGIDPKPTPEEGKFPMKTWHSYTDSTNLVASALKPGSVAARKAKQQLQNKEAGQAYHLGVDPAPGRAEPLIEHEIDQSPAATSRGKIAAARKGKRKADADLGEEGDDEAEAISARRKKPRHTSNLGPSSESPAKVSSKLLSSVDDVFNKMDNPYYKLPDTPEQALEADRMLMTWKAAGRQWRDIVAEWTRISGRSTDESNFSVRHLLIQEKYAHSSKEFDEAILKAKKIAEKQSGGDLWDRVSSILKEDYDMYLRSSVCRRRLQQMEIERKEAEVGEEKEAEAREESEKDYKEAKEALPTELDEAYLGVQEKDPSSYFSMTGEEYLEDRRTAAQKQAEDETSEDELF